MIFPRSIFGLRGTAEGPPQTPLARYLTALWPLWPDKIAAAYRYVMTGQGETVLTELKELAKNPAWQGETYRDLDWVQRPPAPIVPSLPQALVEQPLDDPAVYRRLGKAITAALSINIRGRVYHSHSQSARGIFYQYHKAGKLPEWLGWLLIELLPNHSEKTWQCRVPTALMLADGLKADQFDPHNLIHVMIEGIERLGDIVDMADLISQEWDWYQSTFLTPTLKTPQRTRALEALVASGCAKTLRRQEFLSLLLCGNSIFCKEVRTRLASVDGPDVDTFLERSLTEGLASERIEAARNWLELRGPQATPVLHKAMATDRSERVRTTIRQLLGVLDPGLDVVTPEAPLGRLEIPPCPELDIPTPDPIPADAKAALIDALTKAYDCSVALYRRYFPNKNAQNPEVVEQLLQEQIQKSMVERPCLSMTILPDCRFQIDDFLQYLEGQRDQAPWTSANFSLIRYDRDLVPLLDFIVRDDIGMGCKYRFYAAFSKCMPWWGRWRYEKRDDGQLQITSFFNRCHVDLRQFAKVASSIDGDECAIGVAYLKSSDWRDAEPFRLRPDLIWPYFFEHSELLAKALAPPIDPTFQPNQAWRILEMMPAAPESLVAVIVPFTVGKDKAKRPVARRLLAKHPQALAWALDFAGRADAETRMAGLEWLADLKDARAVPPLVKAFAREKSDAVKRQIVETLEACGHDTSGFFDLAAQSVAATKLLKKGVPQPLNWLPWAMLPSIRLRDGGSPVLEDLVKAWLVEAVLSKDARGSDMLRRKLQIADRGDLAAFGRWVLTVVLAEDTRPLTQEEAAAKANSAISNSFRSSPYFQEMYDRTVAQYLKTTASAYSSFGLLGIAALTCDEGAVTLVRPVLKAYDGSRRAQIIALLNMLSRLPYPTAIQLVLATATRHPVRTVQEEARALVEQIAQERGWTPDELADRTIPTAGLEDDGTLALNFGSSRFVVRLTPQLSLQLENPDGKILKSLPDPRKDDDPERAKAAKTQLSQARKDLKLTVELQTSRLYEAMCVGKTWRFEDWNRDLNRHPIMGRLVQRLIWQASNGDRPPRVFRPLEDGSLSDADDTAVVPAPDDTVSLGHVALVSDAARRQWLQHLADYEILQPFPQFGRVPLPAPYAPDQLGTASAIRDFVGAVMTDAKLRATLKRLGYKAGKNTDGGAVVDYIKPFPNLGLTATIFISGHNAELAREEEFLVAIKEGAFLASETNHPRLEDSRPLAEAPRVLLAELYADLHDAAAAGTMMADWEKRVAF